MNFRFAHYDPPKAKTKKNKGAGRNKTHPQCCHKLKVQQNKFPGKSFGQSQTLVGHKEKLPKSTIKPETPLPVVEVEQLPTPAASEAPESLAVPSVPTQALNILLGQGRLDPFNVYPIEAVSPYVHEVLDHGTCGR